MATPSPLHVCVSSVLPVALDSESVSYLVSMLAEEVDFLRSAPGSLTRRQLTHLLVAKMEEHLVAFELANDEHEAAVLCDKWVQRMIDHDLIELSDADGDPSAASGSGSNVSLSPPKLSAPIRLSDVARSEEERLAQLEVSMASLARASARWSPDEERVLFQSLADMNASAADDDEEEGQQGEEMIGGCEMCERPMPLTAHHLIPRAVHKHPRYATLGSEVLSRVVRICRPCHSAVHRMEDEKTLASRFASLGAIMADERMQRWVKFISKQRVNRTEADNRTGKVLHYAR